jgi:hypothetical protein
MSTGKNPTQGLATGEKAKHLDDVENKISDAPTHRHREENATSKTSKRAAVAFAPGYYMDKDVAADTRMQYRQEAAATTGALSNFKVNLTDADVEFFEKRRRAREMFHFENWLTRSIDITNPANAQWLQDRYPEYWTRREKVIDDQAEIQARAAKIRLRGAKDKEDFYFLWAVDTGRIKLVDTAIWNFGKFSSDKPLEFKAGLFNPTRYTKSYAEPKSSRLQTGFHHSTNIDTTTGNYDDEMFSATDKSTRVGLKTPIFTSYA